MPRKETNYNNTVIYKIQHVDKEDLIYVGSTTDFTKRKSSHKSCCNDPKNSRHNLKVYKLIRENGGWEMFRMIEIKKYSCNDKREAEAEEDKIMKELKANMNTYSAVWDCSKHIENKRIYNINNKERHDRQMKEWYELNKAQRKENYGEVVQCNCGHFITRSTRCGARHQNSKRHINGVKTFGQTIVT